MGDREQLIQQLKTQRTPTEEVILKRRSVRVYKKEQVPEFMVKRILEAGRFAPSAGNCQPWKFIVIRDLERIDELTQSVVSVCKKFKSLIDYREPGKKWRLPMAKLNIKLKPNDLHPVPFGAVSLIADGKFGLYHGAPTVIIILKDVRGVSSPELDCGIAGQNMVLAAHSMGLGTCWVGFTKLAFRYNKELKKKYGIQYPYEFGNSIGIGWPVGEPDGMVYRQTHLTDWYEDGQKKVIGPATINRRASFSSSEKKRLPRYDNPQEIEWGTVEIDQEMCNGCKLCVQVCPCGALEVVEKKVRMVADPYAGCVMCADCQAICPEGAITPSKAYRYSGYYKTLDHGELKPPEL